MKKEFYMLVMKNNKKQVTKVNGYIIETNTNKFGIYKNDYHEFDIIDLNSGLSVNYLHYYKLKDFKEDINLFDDKLNETKKNFSNTYNKYIERFKKILESKEV